MGMRYYPHPPPLEGEPLSEEVILSLQGNNSGKVRRDGVSPHHTICHDVGCGCACLLMYSRDSTREKRLSPSSVYSWQGN